MRGPRRARPADDSTKTHASATRHASVAPGIVIYVGGLAEGGMVLPAVDRRFADVRDTYTIYTFTAPPGKEEWLKRSGDLRRQILQSAGLYPFPAKTPLKARVFGRIDHEGYTVEKVCFESHPGFYVTGNLYRPKGRKGPFPGVLNPHGHWPMGRLDDGELCSEPGRCVSQARLGMVAFSYDMVGYTDSLQVPHSFASPYRAEGRRLNLWGYSSGTAYGRWISCNRCQM